MKWGIPRLGIRCYSQQNGLTAQIRRIIDCTGPITVAQYMRLNQMAWQDPDSSNTLQGYYEQETIGKKGDFITSPELGSFMGHAIALWAARLYDDKQKVRLIECGPGSGKMMDDIMSIMANQVEEVVLVEQSERLRKDQSQRLEKYQKNSLIRFVKHLSLVEKTEQVTLVIGHEFLDALPVHVFQKRDHSWREVMIDKNKSDGLCFVVSNFSTPASHCIPKNTETDEMEQGSQMEVSREIIETVKTMADLAHKGAVLLIDYGHELGEKDRHGTFRAYAKHQLVHPLSMPGNIDLTAHVDFTAVREVLQEHLNVHPLLTQRQFLLRLGIEQKLDGILAADVTQQEKLNFAMAAQRLTSMKSDGLGHFKVMCATSKDLNAKVYPFEL